MLQRSQNAWTSHHLWSMASSGFHKHRCDPSLRFLGMEPWVMKIGPYLRLLFPTDATHLSLHRPASLLWQHRKSSNWGTRWQALLWQAPPIFTRGIFHLLNDFWKRNHYLLLSRELSEIASMKVIYKMERLNKCRKLLQIVNDFRASLVAQMVQNLPAKKETWVRFLDREDPLD